VAVRCVAPPRVLASLYPVCALSTKPRDFVTKVLRNRDRVAGGTPEEAATPYPEELESGHGSSLVATISRDIVRVHAQFYGRGPTRAKTIWRDEIVVCVLEDVFTKAERLLVDHGRFEEVRRHRMAFQDEVEPLFRRAVEGTTGRAVKSFLSQTAEDSVVSEVFVLGPAVGE
jgi:uncharacterized protein YbcI